jgi:hypothetical protein
LFGRLHDGGITIWLETSKRFRSWLAMTQHRTDADFIAPIEDNQKSWRLQVLAPASLGACKSWRLKVPYLTDRATIAGNRQSSMTAYERYEAQLYAAALERPRNEPRHLPTRDHSIGSEVSRHGPAYFGRGRTADRRSQNAPDRKMMQIHAMPFE